MNLNKTKQRKPDEGEQDGAANLLCPPKSATSVTFVHRAHHFPVFVTGLQGIDRGMYPASPLHITGLKVRG